jgi:hypothetical protein
MKNPFDETTLEQEGARAAQAGRSWHTNPYLRRENMPQATGQTPREWARKHDAWQRGFEGRAATVPETKEVLSAQSIAAILEHRLGSLPLIRAELVRRRYCVVRIELPRAHPRDELGRNWDVDSFACGDVDIGRCEAGFRAEVDQVRDRYDLA